MEDVIIRIGLLRSWNADRGYGFIDVPTETFPIQKFFLHVSEICEGANPPPVGSLIRFEAGPPRENGKYPNAQKAWVVSPRNISKTAVRQ